VLVDAELAGVRAHPRERRLRRLPHHLAELPGDAKPAAARIRRRLDEEHVAAGGGVGEPGRDAGLGGALAHLAREAPRPQPLAETLLVEADLLRLPLRDLRRRLPADVGDPALEVANARLARVLADDRAQERRRDRELRALEPVRRQLLGDEVAPRDPELLLL